MYREFVLRNPACWEAFVAVIKANAKACAEKGNPIRLIVTTEQAKRNAEQNKRLWGLVYRTIADQAWVNGTQYNTDTWHEYFARKFLENDEIILPDGEIILRRKSTTQLTVQEFGEYMNKIEAHASMHLGVSFEQ